MNLERYHELLGTVFDGELVAGEAEELARGLGERPEWREDLRRQLLLWELWAQAVARRRRSSRRGRHGWRR